MSINKRRLNILREVTLKNKIEFKYIADKFSVSDRTIRNDIFQINNHLKKLSKNEIFAKNKFLTYENNGIFSDTLKTINLNNYILDNDERIILDIYLLLVATDYITTTQISDILLVSQSSVFNDIDIIRFKLESYDLCLESSPGKGLLIQGEELYIRKLYYDLIDNYIYLVNILENSNIDDSNLSEYLSYKNYTYEIIGKIEYKYNIIFSEESFKELYSYLIYAIHRIKNGSILKDEHTNNNISKISKDIVTLIEEKYKIELNNLEISKINSLIEFLEYKYIGNEGENTVESQFLTRYIIDYVSEQINIPLFMDYKLYESLSFHIERIKNNSYNGDPIDYDADIINLVINNKKLYDVVRESLKNSEEYFKQSLTDNEIYYIMIYLYISIERLLNQIIKELSIVIVCNSGIGTSQLMLLKLKDLFGFKNIETITSRQLNDSFVTNSDLILSTVSLPIESNDYIKVSPMITTKDATLITSLMFKIGNKKLMEIDSIKDSKFIFKKLEKDYVEDLDVKGINYYLRSDNIILDIDVDNWEDSIRVAGGILKEQNKISQKYIEDMVQNIKEYGPYVVIKKGVALPHAEISSDVKETSFLLVRLNCPVYYGADKLDPIKYVCVLAASEKKDHIKALFDFYNLVNNIEFMKKLDLAKNSEEVEELINHFIQEK